jgi:hypothetical protein
MKLTKYQKARLLEYEWDIIETEVDGKEQNCSWVSIHSEDGEIFQGVAKTFGLEGDCDTIRLLVVATMEDNELGDDEEEQ